MGNLMVMKTAWIPTIRRLEGETEAARQELAGEINPKNPPTYSDKPSWTQFMRDYFTNQGWDSRLPDFGDPEYDSKMNMLQSRLDLIKREYKNKQFGIGAYAPKSQVSPSGQGLNVGLPQKFNQAVSGPMTQEQAFARTDTLPIGLPEWQQNLVRGGVATWNPLTGEYIPASSVEAAQQRTLEQEELANQPVQEKKWYTSAQMQALKDEEEAKKSLWEKQWIPGSGGAKFSIPEALTAGETQIGLLGAAAVNPALQAGAKVLGGLGKAANVADLGTSALWGAGETAATVGQWDELSPMERATGLGIGVGSMLPGAQGLAGAARRSLAKPSLGLAKVRTALEKRLAETSGTGERQSPLNLGIGDEGRKVRYRTPEGSSIESIKNSLQKQTSSSGSLIIPLNSRKIYSYDFLKNVPEDIMFDAKTNLKDWNNLHPDDTKLIDDILYEMGVIDPKAQTSVTNLNDKAIDKLKTNLSKVASKVKLNLIPDEIWIKKSVDNYKDFMRKHYKDISEADIEAGAKDYDIELRTRDQGKSLKDSIEEWFQSVTPSSLKEIGEAAEKSPEYLKEVRGILKERFPSGYIEVYRGTGGAGAKSIDRPYINVTSDIETAKTFEMSSKTVKVGKPYQPMVNKVLIKVDDVVAIASVDESEFIIPTKILDYRMNHPIVRETLQENPLRTEGGAFGIGSRNIRYRAPEAGQEGMDLGLMPGEKRATRYVFGELEGGMGRANKDINDWTRIGDYSPDVIDNFKKDKGEGYRFIIINKKGVYAKKIDKSGFPPALSKEAKDKVRLKISKAMVDEYYPGLEEDSFIDELNNAYLGNRKNVKSWDDFNEFSSSLMLTQSNKYFIVNNFVNYKGLDKNLAAHLIEKLRLVSKTSKQIILGEIPEENFVIIQDLLDKGLIKLEKLPKDLDGYFYTNKFPNAFPSSEPAKIIVTGTDQQIKDYIKSLGDFKSQYNTAQAYFENNPDAAYLDRPDYQGRPRFHEFPISENQGIDRRQIFGPGNIEDNGIRYSFSMNRAPRSTENTNLFGMTDFEGRRIRFARAEDRPAGSGAYYKRKMTDDEIKVVLKRANMSDADIEALPKATAESYAQNRLKFESETAGRPTVPTGEEKPSVGASRASQGQKEQLPASNKVRTTPEPNLPVQEPFDLEYVKKNFYEGLIELKNSGMNFVEKKNVLMAKFIDRWPAHKNDIIEAFGGMSEVKALEGAVAQRIEQKAVQAKSEKKAARRQTKAQKLLDKQKTMEPPVVKKEPVKQTVTKEPVKKVEPKKTGTGKAVYEKIQKDGKVKSIDVELTGNVKNNKVEIKWPNGTKTWADAGKVKGMTPEVQVKVSENGATKIDEVLGNDSVSSKATKKTSQTRKPKQTKTPVVEGTTGTPGTFFIEDLVEPSKVPLMIRLGKLLEKLRLTETINAQNRDVLRAEQLNLVRQQRKAGVDIDQFVMPGQSMSEAYYGAVDISADEFKVLKNFVLKNPKANEADVMQLKTFFDQIEQNAVNQKTGNRTIVRPDVSQRKLAASIFRDEINKSLDEARGLMTKDEFKQLIKELGLDTTTRQKIERWLYSRGIDMIDILNVPRIVAASFDLSAPFQQGFIATIAHPDLAIQDMKMMVKAFGNYDYALATDALMRKDFGALLMERHGLELPPINQSISATEGFSKTLTQMAKREEAFASKYLTNVVGFRNSQAAYITYLNQMRYQLGKRAVNAFAKLHKMSYEDVVLGRLDTATGKRIGLNADEAKELSAMMGYINVATGRGYLPGRTLKQAQPLLNALFFSPKLLAARLEIGGKLFSSNAWVRQQAWRDLFVVLGFVAATTQVAKLMGATVEYDPRSSDFMKVKVGNTRLEVWGGMSQYIRAAAQMATWTKMNEAGKTKTTPYEVGLRFFQSKGSPLMSLFTDLLMGRNYIGEKMEWTQDSVARNIWDRIFPMAWQGIVESIYNDPPVDFGVQPKNALSQGLTTIPNLFGMGANTYKVERKAAAIPDMGQLGGGLGGARQKSKVPSMSELFKK